MKADLIDSVTNEKIYYKSKYLTDFLKDIVCGAEIDMTDEYLSVRGDSRIRTCEEEVRMVLRKFDEDTSAGPDGFTIKDIRDLGGSGVYILVNVFNSIF